MISKETLENFVSQSKSVPKAHKKLLQDIVDDIERLHKNMSEQGYQVGYHMRPELLNKLLRLMGVNIIQRHFIKKKLQKGDIWRGVCYIPKAEMDKNFKEKICQS